MQVLEWLCAVLALLLLWTSWRAWSRSHRLLLPERPPGQTAPSLGSTPGQACDVFICHRGPEVKRGLVGQIKERLQRANLTVFVDYKMRKGVQSWSHVLATLRGARRVLILLTPGFEESAWCLEEARAAAARLDAVLPVFIDRAASWDEGKLPAAVNDFKADRDFDQLRTEEPELAADILTEWRISAELCGWHRATSRTALTPGVNFASLFMSVSFCAACNDQAHDTKDVALRSYPEELVGGGANTLLEGLLPAVAPTN